MGFVNEYISNEDIGKFKIREIWRVFDRFSTDEEREVLMGGYSWTVDKSKEIFMFPVESGRDEKSNETTFAFSWKGTLLSFIVARVGGNSDFKNNCGSAEWGLINLWKPEGFSVDDCELISAIKDALSVYGYRGISRPMESYSVTFTF